MIYAGSNYQNPIDPILDSLLTTHSSLIPIYLIPDTEYLITVYLQLTAYR
jgi:hypothetical protein